MALTTYRSKVAINTIAREEMAYERLIDLLRHLRPFGVSLRRVELMPDNFVEVDLNDPLPNPQQVDHLGLQGPV